MRMSDWSSDVCSSDLEEIGPGITADLADGEGRAEGAARPAFAEGIARLAEHGAAIAPDRQSAVSGKSVSVRVDLAGRPIIQENKILQEYDRVRHYQYVNSPIHMSEITKLRI